MRIRMCLIGFVLLVAMLLRTGSAVGSYTSSPQVIPLSQIEESSDLVITDVWNENNAICYQVRNIGAKEAAAGHRTALYVDLEPRTSDLVAVALPPGARLNRCFDYVWQCSSLNDEIRVFADAQGIISEADEANNCREETWKCDSTPPEITFGPAVSEVTESSAVISWGTDEDSDSYVEFDTSAGRYGRQESDAQLTQDHQLTLTNLEPSSVYHFLVRSNDASNNEMTGQETFFETSPIPDNLPPTVSALTIDEREAAVRFYDITAAAHDNVSITKVEFYLDDTLIGMDYSAPFAWPLVPSTLDMVWGEIFTEHEVRARAFDYVTSVADWVVFDPPYECEEIRLEFNFPYPDYTLYTDGDTVPPGTIVPVEVNASIPRKRCTPTFTGYPDSAPDYVCSDTIEPVSTVEFSVDGVPLTDCIGDPDLDHSYICDWNASGFPALPHDVAIRVDALADDDCKQTGYRYVTIERGEPSLELVRSVTRVENYYRVELTFSNEGTATSADLDRLVDNVTGFQAVEGTGVTGSYGYDVTSECMEYSTTCDVEIDLYDAGGTSIRLGPGESLHLAYLAVPVLYSLLDSVDVDDYAIGRGAARVLTVSDGEQARFERPWRPHASLWDAVGAADYLLVTNPANLFSLSASSDVNDLLSAMAELAQLKRGVLGYLSFATLTARAADDDIEAWGRRLRGSDVGDGVGDYLSNGSLLLVGETEIVPSSRTSYASLPWNPSLGNVDYTDRIYADTAGEAKYPDLAVGRIIGNNASVLQNPIRTSIDIARDRNDFDNSDANAVSGGETGANLLPFAENRRNVAASLRVAGYSVTEDDEPSSSTFFSHTTDIDVLFLSGHGDWNVWNGITATDVSAAFDPGSARPLVYAMSCLTGRYPEGRSIAEAFLAKGASGYVGATEISLGPWSGRLAEEFFARWRVGKTAGATLNEAKVYRLGANTWEWDDEYNGYNCAIFDLYGDPKVQATAAVRSIGTLEMAQVPAEAPSPVQGPVSSLAVSVPLYQVTSRDGQDHVTIPGGRNIFVPGRPSVPSFSVFVNWPAEYRVQDVVLLKRETMVTGTGLNIPAVFTSTDGTATAAPASEADAEWWPDRNFDWAVVEKPAGASTLVVEMYPFYYNALTTDARFYQDYYFEIHYTTPSVEVVSLTTDKDAYAPGSDARIDLWLSNAGDEQDVIVNAVVRGANSGDVADGLLLRSLKGLKGFASFSAQWNTGTFEPGDYYVEAEIRDTAGNVLHRAMHAFDIGVSSGAVSAFTATPTVFPVGETVDTSLVFDNTGTMSISGTAVIQVQYETGGLLTEFRHDFSDLAPAASIRFEDRWDMTPVGEGTCRVVGYVAYDARATAPVVVLVRTRAHLYVPMVMR